ncbi:hypothetical protein FTO74_05215 [Granulicella sp. WH15]|uniref:hypothetical protein n=1 Tax=Granulicella sp. WH15 TaxID=2602070 RepID=UPI001366D23E|nr:hypothetical protein [Granulicella sp. WH15]QHN02840.1 hypothetical protein FTO74_05215 [Granulicella sp. WH15]
MFCLTAVGTCQEIGRGTPLTIQLDAKVPMRVGQALNGHLLHPVFQNNRLVLPEGTAVHGTVIALRTDKRRRVRGRLRGDFTPFHVPVVRFDEVVGPDGRAVKLQSGTATDGAPVYSLVAPPPSKGGFLHQEIGYAKTALKGDLEVVTGPDKGARFVAFVYSQLPYHPESIGKETAWTTEVAEPLIVGAGAGEASVEIATARGDQPAAWMLKAYLQDGLSSETSHTGSQVVALVAEPVFNPDHTIAVPQGTKLLGSVTQARPARWFARSGVLRFDFRQMELPGAKVTSVQATMKAADSGDAALALDSEGQAKPKPKDKLALPLALALLASRPLDPDGHHQDLKNAGGSNGFGIIGRVVGIAAGSAELAAGIGYYQAMLSTYDRWVAKGKRVVFPRDTRIVIETTARRGHFVPSSGR